jgi:hypothetical protein
MAGLMDVLWFTKMPLDMADVYKRSMSENSKIKI